MVIMYYAWEHLELLITLTDMFVFNVARMRLIRDPLFVTVALHSLTYYQQ